MTIEIAPSYMAVGGAVTWLCLFVAFYVYEARSERDDEVAAAIVLASTVLAATTVIAVLMMVIAWITQMYLPVFG